MISRFPPSVPVAVLAGALLLAVGCIASGERAAPGPTPADTMSSPDLARFPMPAHPAGAERVHGEITSAPAAGKLDTLLVARDGGLLRLTARGLRLNCCTERLRAGTAVADGELQVRLYQYLPDVCECFHRRDVTLSVAAPAGVTRVALFLDADAAPAQTARLPR